MQKFRNLAVENHSPSHIANSLKGECMVFCDFNIWFYRFLVYKICEFIVIPRVPKNRVNMNRTIGKGSFGEVFEGVVTGLPLSPNKKVRVAIKVNIFYIGGYLLEFFKFVYWFYWFFFHQAYADLFRL